jgi:hypothetical protein
VIIKWRRSEVRGQMSARTGLGNTGEEFFEFARGKNSLR